MYSFIPIHQRQIEIQTKPTLVKGGEGNNERSCVCTI